MHSVDTSWQVIGVEVAPNFPGLGDRWSAEIGMSVLNDEMKQKASSKPVAQNKVSKLLSWFLCLHWKSHSPVVSMLREQKLYSFITTGILVLCAIARLFFHTIFRMSTVFSVKWYFLHSLLSLCKIVLNWFIFITLTKERKLIWYVMRSTTRQSIKPNCQREDAST